MNLKLFDRQGKKLILTEDGKKVFGYAKEIFSTGDAMMESFRADSPENPAPVSMGASSSVPASFLDSLVNFILNLHQSDRPISVREKPIEQLLQDLWLHKLDFIITDLLPPTIRQSDLNSCVVDRVPVSFFAHPSVAARFPGRFPERLNGAPLILPTSNRILCSELREYLLSRRIQPKVLIEVDDVSLACRMIGAQRGIGPINEHTAAYDSPHKLTALNEEPTGFYRSSYLIWKPGKKDHPVLEAVLKKFKLAD